MEEKELWMNKLKEKLGDYSEPLPASGWEQLEKELMPPVERKIYPYRKWTVAAAAVILLALVSSVSLYFLGTPAADEIRHAKTPALASVPDVLPDAQQPDMTGTTVEPVVRPVVKNRIAKAERNIPQPTANIDEPVKKEEQPSELNAQTGDRKEKEEVEPVEETKAIRHKPADTEQPRNKPRRPSSRDKLHIPAEKASSQKGTWSMGLSVGNSGGASTELGSGIPSYMSRVSMVSVSNGLLSIPNDQQLVFEDGVPYLRQANQVVDMEHHQPISFGLSVRKSLAKGFSVETGLTYTLLSSDAKFADSDQKTEQKLHYLGIPLKANWNFLDKKLFTLYVSGGGMIEKCVYGKLGTEKETVKPLQFSVSGAVGEQPALDFDRFVIVHLGRHRTHFDNRIQQPGRTNHLINHLIARFLQLVVARRRRNVNGLRCQRFKLFKLHRLGFAVVFHARRIRMLIEPNLFGWLTFGKEQQVGFNAGIGVKHPIR